jgi:hypothetical protein
VAEYGAVTRALLAAPHNGTSERALAEQMCKACLQGLDVDGAAFSVMSSSVSRVTLWATDPTAELLEELQLTLNEGACMEAATTGSPVLVPDLYETTEIQRWPIFAAAVSEQTRIRALFALPLQWGTLNLGVIDMFRFTPGGLPDEQCRDALHATQTAALMMLARRTDPAGAIGGPLDHSVISRAEIHQATGMVLAQLGISAQEALARLRGYAFAEQRLLIEVARDVVSRRVRFTEEMR